MAQRPWRGITSVISLCIIILVLISACSDSNESEPSPTKTTPASGSTPKAAPKKVASEPAKPMAADSASLAKRGKGVYLSNCIACHNADPSIDGSLGPAVSSASYDLLESRVMRAAYPEGYTPKRDTRAMVAMPYLEQDLDALAAYLNQ